MNQKRQDLEQRKSSLENQLKQAHGSGQQNAPSGPNQWNNQQNQNNQWRNGNYGGGSGNFQGGPQFPGPRGPRDQGPRFDGPQQSNIGAQRFGGPRQRFDGPRGGGPRPDRPYDQRQQNMDDSYDDSDNYYPDNGGQRENNQNRRRFEGDNFDDPNQFGAQNRNRFSGQKGRGPRVSRFDSGGGSGPGGSRFEPRGDAGGGGGPVPLMALNIEKPKSLDPSQGDDRFDSGQGTNRSKPDGNDYKHGDEELLAKLGLPTSFGGPPVDEQEEERPQRLYQMGGESTAREGSRGPPMNRPGSQEDRQFGSRPNVGRPGGPGGARPPGPGGPPPSRENQYPRDPYGDNNRGSWDESRDWSGGHGREWNHQKDGRPLSPHRQDDSLEWRDEDDAQQKSDVSVDPNQVGVSNTYSCVSEQSAHSIQSKHNLV